MLEKINKFAPIISCLLSGAALYYAHAAYDAADSAGYSADQASENASACASKIEDAKDAIEIHCH